MCGRETDRERERKGGGKAKNALLVNPVASHAHTLVHMQRPKIVISWDITRRPTPSHRTCFIPGAAINHAMFNKLQRVGLRNNTHIRREFTRARECCRRYLRFFYFFYYTSGVVLFLSVFNHCLSQSRVCGILRFGRGRGGEVDREDGKGGWITSPTALMHFSTTVAIGESIIVTQRVCSCVFEFNKIRNCGLQ